MFEVPEISRETYKILRKSFVGEVACPTYHSIVFNQEDFGLKIEFDRWYDGFVATLTESTSIINLNFEDKINQMLKISRFIDKFEFLQGVNVVRK